METFDASTPEALAWWLEQADSLTWREASTYRETAPHSYVVRDKTMDYEPFMRAVRVIRTQGVPGKFYDRTNIYLIDEERGLRWWTMGDTLENTIIINQAPLEVTYGTQDAPNTKSPVHNIYDTFATDYDARYDSPECAAENTAVWRIVMESVPSLSKPTILDIGAGTGLALDLRMTAPEKYRAVDPSQAMLNELLRKHPKVSDVWAMTGEDYLNADHTTKFDVVLSLFGSPSYMAPEAIEALPGVANHLVVLMHYIEGYAPDYETVEDIPTHTASREAAAGLLDRFNGYKVRLNNFDVVVVTL